MSDPMSPLVSTEWLAEHVGERDVKVLDASWYLPNAGRHAAAEYVEAHIPGAVFYDIDAVADQSTDLPHMVADPAFFSAMAGALGLSESDTIVCYDGVGVNSAARAWWNLSIMGAEKARVLAGGMPKWRAEKRPVESGVHRPSPARFRAKLRKGMVVTAGEIAGELEDENRRQVVDVRAADRFNAKVDEPRPGLRRGRIPKSLNLPFADLVENGSLRSPEDLKSLLDNAGIDPAKPIVTSCGSGVTAPILNLALSSAGYDQMAVYDGSWAEWGGREDLPIEVPEND